MAEALLDGNFNMKPTRKPRSKQAGRVRGTRVQLNGQAEAHVNGNGQAEASKQTFPSTTAHKIKTRKVVYLWDRRLALGTATLLAGETGAGKSLLAARIAAQLTTGEALPGGPRVEACNVAIWTAERHASMDWKPRLALAGANMRRVHFPGWDDAGVLRKRLELPAQAVELRDWLINNAIRLCVIDPIGSFLDKGLEENAASTARAVMQSYIDAAAAAGCSILAIKHPRKGNTGGPLDRISGSKEWVNCPSFVLAVGENPHNDTVRVLASLKPTGAAQPSSLQARIDIQGGTPTWVWRGETSLTAGDILAADNDPLERSLLAEATALLIDRLDAEEQPAKDMTAAAEDAGLSLRTLQRAKRQLGVTSHPKGPNEKRFYIWRKPAGGWPKGADA
jgi:hypothetical protein